MGLAGASVTVVAAGAIGGGFRLMLYPQFVIGMTLTIASVVLKLSRHAAGLGILLLVSLTLGAVLAANSDRLKRLAVRWSPWLWRHAVEGVQAGTEMIGKGLSNTPPHVFTTALFLLPAIGQFLGSMATVRMLSNLNLSPQAIPGSQAMTISSGLYLFTLVTGFSKPWLTPQKVSFVLQTVWLLAAIFSSSGGDLEIKQYLPSVLAGWGSLFLSMTPASALVHAAKSATASALVAAASVATIHGVAAITPGKENPQDTPLLEGEHDTSERKSSQVEYDSENSESLDDLASEEDPDRLQRTATSKSEAIVAAGPDLKSVLESWRDRFDERAIAAWFATTFSRENAVQVLDSFRNKSRKEKRRSSRKQSVLQNEADAEMEEDALELEEEARQQGFDITSLSPPMSVAVPVTLFRAFPTLLALIVGVSLGVLKMVQGDFKPAMLAIPVLLAPLALGEFITVSRKFGLRALLTWKLSPPDTAEDEVNDGLSLLMWQSPTMLEAWKLVNTVEDSNELIDSIKEAPGRYFNPSEATIAATPPLTRRIVFELCVSILIDVIGAATYTIPFVGELADLIWAPIQGLLVQYLYRMPMLSWIGVVEEILPFTDLLPTATIGWFYQYWKFLPVWAILIARDIRDSTFRKPKAE